MTYDEAKAFLEQTRKYGSVLGLDNMKALMQELGNPQNQIPMIHIAGTNGQGSVGTYLASCAQELGLSWARYCSPAVFDSMECWQYNGRNITKEEYAYCVSQIANAYHRVVKQGIYPTMFELETAIAFVYGAWKKPDVFFLETGLGGSTDATNVVKQPVACVFTTISYDHMQFLGNTLTEIASVKAGIIKPGAKVFLSPQVEEVSRVFTSIPSFRVKEEDVELQSVEPGCLTFTYQGEVLTTGMSGIYQMRNASLAYLVMKELYVREEGDKAALVRGIQKATWPGRFEVLSKEPYVILDGAHNEDAAKVLALTLEKSFTNQKLIYIIKNFGVVMVGCRHPLMPIGGKVKRVVIPSQCTG
ncbi:MAG: bifunctional folylpolyglutamate synthase/dihydrofolate synthase, partial [Agathobacter sp.]|nr:bifunctional folylpolyglutamate synthase/dihydrofolate synthase [Agathobacter sp.]